MAPALRPAGAGGRLHRYEHQAAVGSLLHRMLLIGLIYYETSLQRWAARHGLCRDPPGRCPWPCWRSPPAGPGGPARAAGTVEEIADALRSPPRQVADDAWRPRPAARAARRPTAPASSRRAGGRMLSTGPGSRTPRSCRSARRGPSRSYRQVVDVPTTTGAILPALMYASSGWLDSRFGSRRYAPARPCSSAAEATACSRPAHRRGDNGGGPFWRYFSTWTDRWMWAGAPRAPQQHRRERLGTAEELRDRDPAAAISIALHAAVGLQDVHSASPCPRHVPNARAGPDHDLTSTPPLRPGAGHRGLPAWRSPYTLEDEAACRHDIIITSCSV